MRRVISQQSPSASPSRVMRTDALPGCAACVAHLADLEFGLLPEIDARVVSEHLDACPECRLFKEQLDTTREVLAGTPAPDLVDVLDHARAELADGRLEHSLEALYRIASALDVDDPDELVQDTLLDAISKGRTLSSVELADALIRRAHRAHRPPTASLDDDDAASMTYDADSDTAELFYPEFYEAGPDAGRFIDSPNVWGHVRLLAPHEEVESIELFDVAHAAVKQLPELERRLIRLVDMERVAFDDAARELRVPTPQAARALNVARIHVRGAIDDYRTTREAPIIGHPSGAAAPASQGFGSSATTIADHGQ